MTAAFAAMIAASVAVTDAAPITAILFSIAASLLSFCRATKKYAPCAVALFFALCAITMPITVAATVWTCCIITAFWVKKGCYFPFPLLLVIAFIVAVTNIKGENPCSLPQLGLLFLLPCASAIAPSSRIKGLCIALAVALPISFGGGGSLAVCLLLPALIPVLLYGGKSIQSKRE